MATPGGYWRPADPNRRAISPVAPAAPVDPNRAARPATPPAAALGIPTAPAETPEQRAARTGVNVGGVGAVSGQVAPPAGSGTGTSALAALGVGGVPAPGSTGAPGTPGAPTTGFASGPTDGWRSGPQTAAAPTPPPPSGSGWRAAGAFGAPDTATVTSGLSSGAPGTATQTSAITSGGTGGNTGTTAGYNPADPAFKTVESIPIIGDGLSMVPGYNILKGLTTTSAADLTPALASQRAAFGIQDDLNRERFDYRPGDAPSMNIDSDIRRAQLTALGGLRDAATGAVPSAAELQTRREAGRAAAATLGQARALGGRSAGGAARAGTMAAADILARNNVEGGQLRAAEQERARAAEIAALSGTRGQDTDISKSNLGAQLDTNQLSEQHRRMLLEAQLQALGIGRAAGGDAVATSKANADAENKMKGGIVGGITSALGM